MSKITYQLLLSLCVLILFKISTLIVYLSSGWAILGVTVSMCVTCFLGKELINGDQTNDRQ